MQFVINVAVRVPLLVGEFRLELGGHLPSIEVKFREISKHKLLLPAHPCFYCDDLADIFNYLVFDFSAVSDIDLRDH